MKIFTNLLDFFFPALCVACERRLHEHEAHLCLDCLSELPKTDYHGQRENKLEAFFAGRVPFVRVAAYAHFVKGGMMQAIIHDLKYKNNPSLGHFMGELCGNDLKESDFVRDIDYIVPVPLHPKRQRKRGYNQSEALAKGISLKTGIPVDYEIVKRAKNNPSQAKSSSREARWKNVENIFVLTDKSKFEGKHILLIDDVLTTGSTLESCARVILQCPSCRISIYTLAAAT
ncbi:ComF family protein [Dysgonomonas sp. 25]|uniref:ComF family protein n=1 Tax=Dysgonomonas sp. 25 TaxID=2302933 RepID=UPI0013D3F3F3|nr:ComF family protein [Dysgonomonas sp. 25]NDV70222.1 ComF family protein [Dysgonomonas sp. 25]